ncbi:hypothetical protein ACFST9_04250 [Hymenobacter monticola]|uniref:Uncharacterized protein n=1 Tax=Hymenobacter monticola TaxID=1705399 RepID=A0ABY4B209_9BACT|nr:hypothetical protein [Hymenobacter monticola]UOE32834.1 hypothetical protein MTP16_17070 [Hymenobacter monticola]
MANYLITESYFKSRTSVSKQLDPQSIKTVFTTVEEFYIKEMLGIPLYEIYKGNVNGSNTEPLTSFEQELLDKVMYYYALMAEWEVLFNLFDISNKGNTVEQNAASVELVRMKRGEVLSKAEQLKAGILSFLKTNKEEFSNYFPSTQTNQARAEAVFPIVFDHAPKYYYGI